MPKPLSTTTNDELVLLVTGAASLFTGEGRLLVSGAGHTHPFCAVAKLRSLTTARCAPRSARWRSVLSPFSYSIYRGVDPYGGGPLCDDSFIAIMQVSACAP